MSCSGEREADQVEESGDWVYDQKGGQRVPGVRRKVEVIIVIGASE